MRGLKSVDGRIPFDRTVVAPFTGAWIEIKSVQGGITAGGWVAPFTGAWIEIASQAKAWAASESRTLHGCVD